MQECAAAARSPNGTRSGVPLRTSERSGRSATSAEAELNHYWAPMEALAGGKAKERRVQEGKEESETHKRSTAVVQPSQSCDENVYAREEGIRGARDATLRHANSNRRRAKSTPAPVQRQSLTRPTAQQSKSTAEQAKADLDGRGMEAHALARNTKEDHVEVVWNIAESQVLRVRIRGDIIENMKRGAASSFAARLPVDKSLTPQTCALLRDTAAHYKAILADVPPDTSPECVLATVMLNAERRESVDGARGTLVTAPIVRITVPLLAGACRRRKRPPRFLVPYLAIRAACSCVIASCSEHGIGRSKLWKAAIPCTSPDARARCNLNSQARRSRQSIE